MSASGFEKIVGPERVWMPAGEAIDGVPVQLVVRPRTPEQLAACLAEASARGAALVASGGGTKLGWGNRARVEGLVRLETGDLDAIEVFEPEEGIATAQAGALVETLESRARAARKRTALPPGFPGGTLGGAIATDAFGPAARPDVRLRDEILGLRVALPNGALTRSGGRVVKNVTGFDLVRLYCGSFGTLGVVTDVTLRLRPLPERERVLRRAHPDWGAALAQAREIVERGVDPAGLAARAADDRVELLWRLEGAEADVAARAGRFEGDARRAASWKALAGLRAKPAGSLARVRLGARPSDTWALVDALREAAGERAPVLALPLVGVVWGDVEPDALDALLERAGRERWLPFVERAPEDWKRRGDVFGPAPEGIEIMRRIKRSFDPGGALAPGRFAAGI